MKKTITTAIAAGLLLSSVAIAQATPAPYMKGPIQAVPLATVVDLIKDAENSPGPVAEIAANIRPWTHDLSQKEAKPDVQITPTLLAGYNGSYVRPRPRGH